MLKRVHRLGGLCLKVYSNKVTCNPGRKIQSVLPVLPGEKAAYPQQNSSSALLPGFTAAPFSARKHVRRGEWGVATNLRIDLQTASYDDGLMRCFTNRYEA